MCLKILYKKIRMQFLIVIPFFFVAASAISDEFKGKAMDKMADIANICVPEVGASDADVSELMAKQDPSRREGKCLIACFSKKMGMMKEGKPNKEGSLKALEPLKADDPELFEKVLPILEKCHGEFDNDSEPDECELAYKIATCMHKTAEEHGIKCEGLMGA